MSSTDFPEGLSPNDPVAPDRAFTEHCGVTFTAKEDSSGQCWILLELDGAGITVLKHGDAFVGLACRPGVNLEKASQLAREMSNALHLISYTKFVT